MIRNFKNKLFIFSFCGLIFFSITNSCQSSSRMKGIYPPSNAVNYAVQESINDPLMAVGQSLPEEWWQIFNDPQLDIFITTAFLRNPTLQAVQENILTAAYNADRLASRLFPQITGGADLSRQKLSETGLIPFGSQKSSFATPGGSGVPTPAGKDGIPVYFTQYETELSLTYEFDLWGKNRNTLKAAIGEMRARAADARFAQLKLGIAIARVYFQLQVEYKRLAVANKFLENRTNYVEIIKKRIEANIENNQGQFVALTNMNLVMKSLLDVEKSIEVHRHQLQAYLAGDFDEEVNLIPIKETLLPKVPLPYDIPLHLIARRPDIVSQLWLIESAGKEIDVAQAGFYPDFNLTAFLGYQTIQLHKIFNKPSSFFNVNPAVSLPLFEGGRLIANLRGSEVNYDLAILKYNELVIEATKEVLDGMAVLKNQEKQLKVFENSTTQQESLKNLAQLRLENSLGNVLDTLVAEQNVLFAQDQELVALGEKIQAILSLIKALGGGYEVCLEEG